MFEVTVKNAQDKNYGLLFGEPVLTLCPPQTLTKHGRPEQRPVFDKDGEISGYEPSTCWAVKVDGLTVMDGCWSEPFFIVHQKDTDLYLQGDLTADMWPKPNADGRNQLSKR